MSRTVVVPLLLALAFLTGCISVDTGGTAINLRTDSEAKEARIRTELWRIEKAVEQVRFRYGLNHVPVEVIVTDLGGLGETIPALDGMASVHGGIVRINESTLLDLHPDTDDILLGLFAHELAHALHYDRLSPTDLARLGTRYNRYYNSLDEELRPWIEAYEQLTDMTAIALGYAEPLIHQKHASEANLATNHPDHVWDFYLNESEIRALDADRSLLYQRIDEALAIVDLPSLNFLAGKPVFDEFGLLQRFEERQGTQP